MPANQNQNLWKWSKEKREGIVLAMLGIVLFTAPVLMYVKISNGLWSVLAVLCGTLSLLSLLVDWNTSSAIVGGVFAAFLARYYLEGGEFNLMSLLMGLRFLVLLFRCHRLLGKFRKFNRERNAVHPAPVAQ